MHNYLNQINTILFLYFFGLLVNWSANWIKDISFYRQIKSELRIKIIMLIELNQILYRFIVS